MDYNMPVMNGDQSILEVKYLYRLENWLKMSNL